ncbi:MAG: DrmB family protein [Longimicrobiales bacterium]
MNRRASSRPHGQLRQSQVITTFGPGALLDLPRHSVIVGGLDHWGPPGLEVHEPRLVAKLERILATPGLRLFAPPIDEQDPAAPPNGITVWQFPEWFITQDADWHGPIRSRHLVHRKAVTRGRYIDDDRRKRSVVPIRFVRACRRGHIGDIDWRGFVHKGPPCTRKSLRVEERGTSGDLSEIWVRCDCGAARQISEAATIAARALGHCDGNRPWLGPHSREQCGEINRLLVRTATNAYFSQNMSVISLPEGENAVTQAVDRAWQHYLEFVDTVDAIENMRRIPPVGAALDGIANEQILEEVRRRRSGTTEAIDVPVKQAELAVLLSSREEIGSDRPEGTFYARTLPRAKWEGPVLDAIDRVVLVHRLREVIAQVGFTRFEAASPDEQGELDVGVERAALAREATWLPAVENRGEGVFIALRKDAVQEWLADPRVIERGNQLDAGFTAWRADHKGTHRKFPGLPYIMLHTLSHLLLTAVSLECGYPASSIRERVYANELGYGILLYTGSPDAEGTLGGLVEAGRSIRRHFQVALELGRLCSNDPVCAQHEPHDALERRFLLGAACHGCVLISETSCEQHNDLLDRALVVPTVNESGAAFFKEPVA